MQSYSVDLRERIIKAKQQGHSSKEVAKRFGVCTRSVERYWKRFEETGNCEALQRGGRRISRLKPHLQTLRTWIEEQNDMTIAQMIKRLRKELGVKIKYYGLWYQLNKLGLTYKKNAARKRTRTPRRERDTSTVDKKPAKTPRDKTRLH